MVQLYNDRLSVSISPKGAELTSLRDRHRDYEWLWQADPAHWAKQAPVLFPFIGCVKGGHYSHNGKTYPMTKHGFARDLSFEIEDQTQESACLVLKHSAQTLALYPFEFELRLSYSLVGDSLKIGHEVKNTGDQVMHFSLGAHPAFNCSMDTEDWVIAFEGPEVLESACIDLGSGLILEEVKCMGAQVEQLPLSRGLFEEDALVFENLSSKSVCLIGPKPWQKLSFAFKDFPIMAFWTPSATKAPFICLEPWIGMADRVAHNGVLSEKYGTMSLAAGELFYAELSIKLMGD